MVKKKVLFVSDTFYPRVDGIVRFMGETYKYLKRDFDIKFLVPKLEGVEAAVREKKMKVIYSPTFNFTIAEFKPSRPIRKKIRDAVDWADVVFVNTPGGPLGASIVYAARGKKRLIGYAHTIDWELFPFAIGRKSVSRLLKPIFRRIYSNLDLILAPDKMIVDSYKKAGIKSKFKIVPLNADQIRFKENLFDRLIIRRDLGVSGDFVVGFHGRLSKEKNIKLLVDSFKAFRKKRPRSTLLVLGDGPERDKLEGDGIISTGFVSDPERYLKAMDVYVFLSKTETSALSLMEAISSGVPVVTSNAGLIPTYVNSRTGIVLKKAELKREIVVRAMDMVYKSPVKSKLRAVGAKLFTDSRNWNDIANDLKRAFVD
jgi:glycosyltransferase involved in cell wall biosynthesis|tara:strand:+ start:3508 stop:4620 length:1113 start_codon:yes stop_codon:yes gene_type:complete